jgi:hypothetical protein
MPVTPGDPFGPIKNERGSVNPTPAEVKAFHDRSDRDSGIAAEHHTLGSKRGQSSPGDHIHDGKGCRKLGGQTFTLTGLNAPATVANLDTIVDQLIVILQTFVDITDART